MGLASRGGTPLQDLALRRIPGAPGQNLDPGLNPGELASFTSSSSSHGQRWPSLVMFSELVDLLWTWNTKGCVWFQDWESQII